MRNRKLNCYGLILAFIIHNQIIFVYIHKNIHALYIIILKLFCMYDKKFEISKTK